MSLPAHFADLAERARRLRTLHVACRPLVLPNAWDAASARIVEAAGFPGVATASSAVSASLGYEDEEGTPPGEMFASIRRIARAVAVPVTADLEAGYGLASVELAEMLLDAGAVGCNLEDTAHGQGGLVDARPQAPPLPRLAALGIARVSFGPWVHRLAMRETEAVLRDVATGLDPYSARGPGSRSAQ